LNQTNKQRGIKERRCAARNEGQVQFTGAEEKVVPKRVRGHHEHDETERYEF
jgi:hypothetical protein